MSRPNSPRSLAQRQGDLIVLPGLATAHSHAFQRALRGLAQRSSAKGSFWSWREAMYKLAAQLDPESIYAISRYAFAELARHGVCAVGEFHYVHHQPDGTPYADRVALADAVIHAARDVGIRITLLRVLYHRAGADRQAEGTQRRFSDTNLASAVADIEELIKRWADDDHVRIGIAPHSVRAVPARWIAESAPIAARLDLPFHMHVAEQVREIEECEAEHDRRPVELLHECGALTDRFVAVHATHLEAHEAKLLRSSFACICRTTERDLGDGLPNLAALRQAGTRLCAGVDSHSMSDPIEELRAIELDERTRTQARHVVANGTELLHAGSESGYAAIGLRGKDQVSLDAHDWSLGATPGNLDDTVVFGASGRAVREVQIGDKTIVRNGTLVAQDVIREQFEKTCRKLLDA